jgi:tripartite-type tricarboxylate transporter receptor subunit TctC
MGQWLSERLGQQFVVENRPGAGGNIGTEAVVRAPSDGYTLLLALTPNAINATLYDRLNFNFIRDIAPVAGIVHGPLVMVMNPAHPTRTVPDFIAYAKANPGKVNMASGGVGTPGHLAGELFKIMTGVNLVHVPYRGEAPALTDTISGQVQLLFVSVTPSLEFIRAGNLRALAVTTTARSPAMPDVPTIAETVPGYEANGWAGMGAPKGTPPEIIEKLNGQINAALASPAIKARYADLAIMPLVLSPADFGKFVAEDTQRWAKVIRAANIKPE